MLTFSGKTRLGVVIAAACIVFTPSTASAGGTTVICDESNLCSLVATADAEYLGILGPPANGSGGSGGGGQGPACTYQSLDDYVFGGGSVPGSVRHAGAASYVEGTYFRKSCTGADGTTAVDWILVATEAGGAPVQVIDPAVVARDAISQLSSLTALVPDAHLFPGQLSVNRWTYLWVTDPGAVTATAAAGTVSVTATAKLKSVTWSMGEPVAGATFTCQGPGRNPGPDANTAMVGDPEPGACSYAFHRRSLDERTGGSGSWKVTAQAHWAVTWESNTGVTGADTLQVASVSAASVGEWRTVIVPVDPNCCR